MTDYADIRAALEAGPTPGPWKWAADSRIATVTTVAEYRIGPDYKTSGQARYDFHAACEIDAAYIAAANPEAIRDLLAERDAMKATLEAALAWHEAQDKAISKQPNANMGHNGWMRLEHKNQAAMIMAALAQGQGET